MNLNEITDVVESYRKILLQEWNAIAVLASSEVTTESYKMHALLEAYEDGTISGKNAEARKLQTQGVLESDEGYQLAVTNQLSNRNNMKQLEIERKCVETRISLLRAWLYSQSNTEAK